MRVEKININSSFSRPVFCANSIQTNPIDIKEPEEDRVEFSVKPEKPSFISRIISKFKPQPKELTPEEQKNEEIKALMGGLYDESREIRKYGKYYRGILNAYLKLGQTNNFKPYIESPVEDRKILFTFDKEKTDKPTGLCVFDMAEGFKLKERYDFYDDDTEEFLVEDYYLEDSDAKYLIKGNKLVYCSETDKETGIKKTLFPSDNGFFYCVSLPPEKDGEEEIITEQIYFNTKQPERCKYSTTLPDGSEELYCFNIKRNMWELKK